MRSKDRQLIWWGRSDPAYSRNAIMIQALDSLGWEILYFRPHLSAIADLEATLRIRERPTAIWVPAFRQRDYPAARRFSRRLNIPVIFDPLISSYDKRVFEFRKIQEGSRKAARLQMWETSMFSSADLVIADTISHKVYFEQELGARPERCFVVPVGADSDVFKPQLFHKKNNPPEAFFYGSFLPLHGVETVIKAARICPEVKWTLLGNGALRTQCEDLASGLSNLHFENPIPYQELSSRIGKADVVLGVFGTTPKAGRVIPNKVFQALACGRPVVTRASEAYPAEIRKGDNGLHFVQPGNPQALAEAVGAILLTDEKLEVKGAQAYRIMEEHFSLEQITTQLNNAFAFLDDRLADKSRR
ncbi:MAG: glycosyltransferase [Kiritimatiellae bacterium]|nr:glycosyltransferase [Kiritimatiellia bacterium]